MTTLTTSNSAATRSAVAAVGVPHTSAARTAVSAREAMYQNGIARPSTRPPSARAASDASAGRRNSIGLTTTATANSTPTMRPTTVAVTTARTDVMARPLFDLATLEFLALLS